MAATSSHSPVQMKCEAMRWMAPTKRPMCSNCKRAKEEFKDPDSPYETIVWHCGLGGFATLKQAVCSEWEAL